MGELKECGWKKADEKKEAEVGETAIKCWQKSEKNYPKRILNKSGYRIFLLFHFE